MDSRVFSLVLMAMGILILVNSLHIINISIIYLLLIPGIVGILLLITTKVNLYHKVKDVIVRAEVKGSIQRIKYNSKEFVYVPFKIIGKETSNQQIDYSKEISQAIEVIKRHKERKVNVAILTTLDPYPGSGFIFYREVQNDYDETDFITQVLSLKNVVESIAPHISLEPVSINDSVFLPFPKVMGGVVFSGYIFYKRFSVEESDFLDYKYDIEIGKTIDNYQIPVGFLSSDVFKHIAIFGATGSGKTNTASVIAKELFDKGFNVVVLDWHGEYKNYLSDFNYYGKDNIIPLNPIAYEEQDTEDIIEITKEALELTEPQTFLMYLVLEQLKRVRRLDSTSLKLILESINAESYMIRDIKFALGRKLYVLTTPQGRKLFSIDGGDSFIDLGERLKGGNIIDLSTIYNIKLRRLYALYLMKFLFEYYQRFKDPDKKAVIIVEEAQNYFNGNNEILKRALQEIRKFNIGLCIVSQSPSSVDPEVMKNTSIKIIHSIKSNLDKKIISDSIGLDKEQINTLDKLDIGEAVFIAPNIRKNILIKIKKIG
ncbi:MAG: ATP-binding protein [Sulfolobaceae archaeon]